MDNLDGTIQAFGEYLAHEGIEFALVATDGTELSYAANLDDDALGPHDLMPQVACEVMEQMVPFARLVLNAAARYAQRNGKLLELKIENDNDKDNEQPEEDEE